MANHQLQQIVGDGLEYMFHVFVRIMFYVVELFVVWNCFDMVDDFATLIVT